ncbi:MAG: hypothetical protein ACFHWX_02915 [Bacteroidota bacterium]
MTDDEFEVLDELYFVQSFQELTSLTQKDPNLLRNVLSDLYEKGWIRVFKGIDDEISKEDVDWIKHSSDYLFLASKEGLMAHNTID